MFVKVAFDSLVGNTFIPRQYNYTIPYVTNSQLQNLTATRTIRAPDIVISAATGGLSPGAICGFGLRADEHLYCEPRGISGRRGGTERDFSANDNNLQ